MPTHEEFWEKLQKKVCAKCVDGDGHGNCRIDRNGFCAMKTYFPLILDVVQSVHSDSMVPYEKQLRNRICSACEFQRPQGGCVLRDEVECSLDRYFPLIVEVIEENQIRH